MRRLSIFIFSLFNILIFTGCEDFFETESDRQIFDPALNEKVDSMFYTLGIMKGLQQVADQYVMTGEMRGDLVATNIYTETDLRELADFSAGTSNKFNEAYLYYNVINNCNYYIAHRDTMLLTGSRKVAIPEYVEALAVRAWTYMQLAKTYGEVPFYTDPLVSIEDANRNLPTKDLQGICDALAPELIKYSGTTVPSYGSISAGVLNGGSTSEEKIVESAKIMLPVDAVLGDLFLETHDYEKAAQYYFNYIKTTGLVAHQAIINPRNYSTLLYEKLPNDMSVYTNDDDPRYFSWSSIFNISGPQDIVSYIPLASNKLRGVTTELPRYFGFDFYSTTSGTSSNERYLVERQIDASSAYTNLNKKQDWYYVPSSSVGTGTTIVKTADLGDMRRFATFKQVTREDSTFNVMTKFISANVPIYRTATIYLRLAEAMNRMGQPEAAFAILKDGINTSTATSYDYFHPVDSTPGSRMSTMEFLTTKVPFFSKENSSLFEYNWGIHARGTNYTMGAFSPYQLDTLVAMKMDDLKTLYGITPTGTLNDTINALEDIICDEMALELAFEGNRFGDLTRLARHKNRSALYGADFGSLWLSRKLAYKNPSKSLLDEKNWYLPLK